MVTVAATVFRALHAQVAASHTAFYQYYTHAVTNTAPTRHAKVALIE
jgi:hypothetical protein